MDKILIVDDEPIAQELAKSILENSYEIVIAASAKEACTQIEKTKPSLILLDIWMPETNGFQFMTMLKENPAWNKIPVIFLTADNDAKTEIRCFKEGAYDYIRKPFIKEVMEIRISRTLELVRLRKSLESEVEKQTGLAEDRQKQYRDLAQQTIETMARAIDAKDRFTSNRSMRVAKYACMLGKKLGFSLDEQENLYYAALLHDIGKISISDRILSKPVKLTPDEIGIIKSHTLIGAGILDGMSELAGYSTGAHFHHENFDGTGYPEGLAGEEIPLTARILAVADAYAELTGNKGYRRYLPQDVVRSEIEKGKGKHFDPEIADAMLMLIDEDKQYTLRENGT
ncbi:MAG TPA: response regulator [Methanocorpusculum sp.]|nr:response regulator [Methanocorpusculum sp.]